MVEEPARTIRSSITLIDDDEIIHYLFKVLMGINKPDIVVQTYSNPYDVLDLIKTNRFQTSAIILDINMPEMSGWDFLKELQELNYNLPVFMLTSSNLLKDNARVKEFKNVMDYFVKPLTTHQLNIIFHKTFAGRI